MKRFIVVSLYVLASCGHRPEESPPAAPVIAHPTPKQIIETAQLALIPRRELFASPDHIDPKLSPDGRMLAWLAPVDGVLNVWLSSTADLSSSRALTADKGRGIRDYRWTYDSKHIVYSQDEGGDENWHILVLDVTTGVSRDATAFQSVKARAIGVSPLQRDRILVALNRRDPEWEDVFELDLEKVTLRPFYENHAKLTGLHASDDFKTLVGERMNDDGSADIIVVDPSKKKPKAPRTIAKVPFEDEVTTSILGFASDGKTLYLQDSRGRDTSALVAMDIASGKTRLLADDSRSDVGAVINHPSTHAPQVAFFEYDTVNSVLLDASVAADVTTLRAVEPGTITWTATLDDERWVVTFAGQDAPPRYYLYDRDSREARFLFSSRSALEKEPLAHRRSVVITARDGVPLVSYLTLPLSTAKEDTQLPEQPMQMVLFVHGGPWYRDSEGYEPVAQWLANRGYAVLQVNFRGSTGFGKRFVNLGNHGWGGSMQDDLVDAVKWAQATNITTPEKVAVFGGSYGGYATLTALTQTPLMFQCGIDIVGPSNLETFIAAFPPYWKPYLAMVYERIGDPRTPEGQQLLRERSPLMNAQAIERPLLIAQGANDPRVKRAESDQLVAALRQRNIPVTYAVFPDEGHGFARPVNRLAFFALAESFLAQYLGGRVEPLGKDSEGSTMEVAR